MANRRFIDPENPPFPTQHFKAWREHSGLTQADVERKFGWPASRVSNLESGRASITGQVLMALARAYRCTVAELISHDPRAVVPDADAAKVDHQSFIEMVRAIRYQAAKLQIQTEELRHDVLPRLKALEDAAANLGTQASEAHAEVKRLEEIFERGLGTLRGPPTSSDDESAPETVND